MKRRTLRAILTASIGATAALLLAGCSSSDADTLAAASTTTVSSSTTTTTSTTVAPTPSFTPERLIDACHAQGQNFTIPLRMFGVSVAEGVNAVDVRWQSSDLVPGEFATQFKVTGVGTVTQHGTSKAFTYACMVSAGATPAVVQFDVTPS